MSLLHQWKCQDNAASQTVVATVGTNAATESGNTSALSVADGPGTALSRSLAIAGAAPAIDISAAGVSFSAAAAFSFAVWIKFDAAAGIILGQAAASTHTIRKSNDTSVIVQGNGGQLTFTVPSLGTGVWRHILVTRTAGNSVRLFADGVESSTGAQALNQIVAPNRVGNRNGGYLSGRVCDVRVYNSDESANVAAIMAEKDAGGGSIVPLVMHLRRQMGRG